MIFHDKCFTNVIHIPPVHFKKLKYYIHLAKACLAPMDPTYHGNNISHHKIYQYLALGKPVFGCEFSAYQEFSRLLYMADDHDVLLSKLDHFLTTNEKPDLREARIAVAKSVTFEKHLSKIESFISANQ
jgi:hypothetical protein